MSGILRFDSKREMDMMAAVLLGKGKKIEPRKRRASNSRYNQAVQWEIRVTPALRWSSQSSYKQMLLEYDSAVNLVNGLALADPAFLSNSQVMTLCNEHWMCGCNVIKTLLHDKCFKCDGSVGSAGSRHPDDFEMKAHLTKKYEEELKNAGE